MILLFLVHCRPAALSYHEPGANAIRKVLDQMTILMVHDVTNPPLAMRFYTYACLAGNEIVSQNDASVKSMYGILHGYPEMHRPDSISGYSWRLAALLAMMETAKKIQPSGKLMDSFEIRFIDSCSRTAVPLTLLENSKRYAVAVARQMLIYAKADGYNKLSIRPRYTPLNKDGSWYPTPPAYFPAVEPDFRRIRSFTLDSSSQFKPTPPVAFSTDKKSPFHKLLLECYAENDSAPQLHRDVANFWDCNPFAVQDNGHLLVGLKKISPGAHWMGITGSACAKSNQTFSGAMHLCTMVAIGITESFICCWDEKYRSNRIRPETAIRKYIDADWKPVLQTPPFPDYLSGHSCISATASVILSHYLGDHFAFSDSVEMPYGLPARQFESFEQASVEAGLSRFYGGIHFMDGISNGREQGLKVGAWVLQKLK